MMREGEGLSNCTIYTPVKIVPEFWITNRDRLFGLIIFLLHKNNKIIILDKNERPELCLGTYEFVATKDYCR